MPPPPIRSYLTRRDYERMIGLKKKKRRRNRKVKQHQEGGGFNRRLMKNLAYLAMISNRNRNRKHRDFLIDNASNEQIDAVQQLIKDFLKTKSPPISKPTLKRLAKEKYYLYQLAESNRKVPIERKKAIVKQRGGFLGALIPLAAKTLLPTVTGSVLKTLLG